MKRFVVCGESLIDLIQAAEQPGGNFSSTWLALSAGGPMNSAVALSSAGRRLALPRPVLPRLVRPAATRPTSARRVSSWTWRRSRRSRRRSPWSASTSRCGELHVPLRRDRELRLAERGPADPDARDDFLHIASLATRGQPGRPGAAGLGGPAQLPDVVRHQRTADRDHRSRRVLGARQAWLRTDRACTTASSRPVTRT